MNPATVHRLLDPRQAAELVAALDPGRPAPSLAFESVWAKPGRYFNLCYRVEDGASSRLVSLCVVDDGEAAKVGRRLQRRERDTGSPAPAKLVADDVLAQAFPFDYRLPQLADCLSPGVVRDATGSMVADGCDVAAYRAGMRCQVRYRHGAEAVAYGKVAVERDPGRRRRVHRSLEAATAGMPMRVPALVGGVDALGLDLVAAVPGRSLHDILREGPDPAPVRAAAAALAGLHAGVEPPADRVHAATDELALAQAWVEWMSGLEPQLAGPLSTVLASLAATLPDGVPATFAHRDFYDKQVLVDGDGLWLLDIDTACAGDPEIDVGNLLSQLFLRGLQWDRIAAYRSLEEAALAAYPAPLRDDVLSWYRRASLLRLACVYQLRPRWRHCVPPLLEEAGRR